MLLKLSAGGAGFVKRSSVRLSARLSLLCSDRQRRTAGLLLSAPPAEDTDSTTSSCETAARRTAADAGSAAFTAKGRG